MLRVPNRGWMPPSRNRSPSREPIRSAVPSSPSGPAAYDTWSRRIRSILTTRASTRHTGVPRPALVLGPCAGEKCGAPRTGARRREVAGRQSSGPHPKEVAPVADRADAIRNVVLVGPAGSGKTTLVETLLVSADVLNRPGSTSEGTTVCDFDESEHRQQRSVGLAQTVVPSLVEPGLLSTSAETRSVSTK